MKTRWSVGLGLIAAVFSAHAQIETNGALLLNIDASSLSALSDGTKVSSWVNTGTLGGDFYPAVGGEGAVYQASVGGAPAVTFAGSANSVMTSAIIPPASILSNHIWSVELWVLNPTLQNPEDQLAWTDRGNWVGAPAGQCMEFRYGSDAANAVEHYDSTRNIPWSGNPPQAGIWHHLAVTRDDTGTERLYADGVLRTTKTVALNLRGGSTFKLGGVRDIAANNWQMLFSGSLAKVRVHDGTLSGAQVVSNYQLERDLYQTTWSGTAGLPLFWNDPANWLGGNVGAAGGTVWIDNGGTAVITNDIALAYLYADNGGLTITDGAAVSVALALNSNMGSGAGNDFNLTIQDGSYTVIGSSTVNLYTGVNGGRADVIVGGAGAAALLAVDRDLISASGNGSAGSYTLLAGGSVYCSNGWFYAAMGVGAEGSVLVDGGTIGFYLADKSFVVNANGARANVVVEDGMIDATADIRWSVGTVTNAAYGAVYLNGGTLRAKRLYAESAAGTNLLYMNGGTIQARDSRANFFENLTAAYLQSGGITFDIPAAVAVTAQQALIEDPASTGGALIKTGGGRLTLNGVNALTGDISVLGGELFFSNTNGLPVAYPGAISVVNQGSIGYARVGGAAQLLGSLSGASAGYLTLFQNNAGDDVDFSTFPAMQLAFNNVTAYTGTFTPYQGQYDYLVEGRMVANSAVLTNAPGFPGRLSITGVAGGGMVLSGNSSFSGGVEIDGATVSMANALALGVQGIPGVADVELRNGAVLRFDAAMDINDFVTNRLMASSRGVLLIGAANAAQDVDVSALPGIVIGSAELSLDYSGTITPSGTAFRLGGGNAPYAGSGNRGLSVNTLADQGSATEVVIATPGIVELKAGNSYSGGTVVSNGAVLFLKEDGLGALPASADPANLYVDGGVLRSGNASFTLPASRGLTVGPKGMELHPWGGFNMTVAGNLSGSGAIATTDAGFVTFAGTDNTYNGTLTIGNGLNIRIGDGPNFDWSAAGITDNGSLWLKTDGTSTFSSSVSGSGVLRKEGSGTLTIDTPQSYTGITYVDAGVLQVSAANILPAGGVVAIAAGAQLDVDGLELAVGALQGAGAVTDSAGTAAAFTVGVNNKSGVFDGTVAGSLALLKTGTGKQSLTADDATSMADVQQGTLDLLNGGSVTGAVMVADHATLSVSSGEPGLRGQFYKLASAPLPADFVSQAAVDAFLSGRTPDLVMNSTYLGTAFDMGRTGQPSNKFPTGYNQVANDNFVVYWSGLFYAETAGTYGFATVSDDGSMVFVDGATVLDNNAMQGYTDADKNIVGNVVLAKGYHEIVTVMYEAGGDQGFTVYMTPPGGPQSLLPNALLFSANSAGQLSAIGTLAGAAGSTLLFGSAGETVLRITGNSDMTFDGDIISDNDSSRLVKEGAGRLTLTSGTSDQSGVLDIQAGSLFLDGGAAVLGVLEMAAGVTTEVTGEKGLRMEFYNRSTADSDYSEFQSQDLWESYLSATFPGGPSYVTNSLMLGVNLDTGSGGQYWPTDYIQGSGAENDTYDAYLHGSIYLAVPGTYTFATGSDDGSAVYIDRTLVVNNGFNQGVTVRSGTITLAAGFHSIAIPYRENTGGNALQVYIGYPGQGTVMLPQSILFGGAVLRGLAGAAGSTLDLGSDGAVLLLQDDHTTHAGTIEGDAATFVQKNGAGTLTLTDDNAGYNGAYSVVSGALQVGDGGLTGALGPSAAASVGAGGTLIFNRAGTVTVGGTLTGNGLIQLNGPGEVYVTAYGNFDGLVEVNNGRLTFAPGITLSPDATITNLAVVEAQTSGTSTFYGNLVGSNGSFVVTGTGTLKLHSESTYSGEIRVDTSATLLVSSADQLGGGGAVVLDGGTLAVTPAVVQGTNELIPALTNTEWRVNGSAAWVTRSGTPWVQLTANSGSQAGSVFNYTKINPALPWYASFRYEVGDMMANPADGMAFVIQNDSRGTAALGSSGGAIGVSGITPSIGFYFNIYNADSIGWVVDGGKVDNDTAISGIDLVAGVDVELFYNGEKLVLTVTQGVNVYTDERVIDLNAKFGGSTVWAGMTAGTGGATAQQFVGEFAMTEAEAASTEFVNTIVVEDSCTGALAPMLLSDGTVVDFAGMELGAGATLDITAAPGSKADTGYLVSVGNLAVASGTATVNLHANGGEAGVLGVEKLAIGSGALLMVTGAISAPSGTLTVAVPTPVPDGVTLLGDFTGATWVGALPALVLVDESGAPVDKLLVLRNGRLFINTLVGTVIILR